MEPALSDFAEPDADDEEVTAHFAILAEAAAPAPPGELDEACSLIAWGLVPESPRAECRSRLLARLPETPDPANAPESESRAAEPSVGPQGPPVPPLQPG